MENNFLIVNGNLLDLRFVYQITELKISKLEYIDSVQFDVLFLNGNKTPFRFSQMLHPIATEERIKKGESLLEKAMKLKYEITEAKTKCVPLNIKTITTD